MGDIHIDEDTRKIWFGKWRMRRHSAYPGLMSGFRHGGFFLPLAPYPLHSGMWRNLETELTFKPSFFERTMNETELIVARSRDVAILVVAALNSMGLPGQRRGDS